MPRPRSQCRPIASLVLLLCSSLAVTAQGGVPATTPAGADVWNLARQQAGTFRFSTLITAQDVRRYLSEPAGVDEAIAWCRQTGVTRIFLETFRGGYTAERATLTAARERFEKAGLLVSGCVTTTDLGRKSVNGWIFPCFTDKAARDKLASVFAYTAALFDEIMIDDFLATRCECGECIAARGQRAWSDFRCNMMVDISRTCILEPARKANPNVRIIIKYPQWYDDFHTKGYEIVRQTQMFDRIWVGTETRDPDSQEWGRKSQYEAYFIMRWLGELGGAKCGGGWFDSLGTSPPVYVEQARQTVLAGSRETVLFCYGLLRRAEHHPKVDALRQEIPQLLQLARIVQGKTPVGIAAPKPPNSPADGNEYVYDYVGLLGMPLVPAVEIRTDAPALFLPVQAAHDPDLVAKMKSLLAEGKPVLLTSQLAERLSGRIDLSAPGVQILSVPADPWKLMDMPAADLQRVRDRMTEPLGVRIEARTRVSVYLFQEHLLAAENFNDAPAEVRIHRPGISQAAVQLSIPQGTGKLAASPEGFTLSLAPRSLAVVHWQE